MPHENGYHDDTCYRIRNKNKRDSRDKSKGKIEFIYEDSETNKTKTITLYPDSVLVLDGKIMNYIGVDNIIKHIEKGELSIKDLVIKPNINYIIRNESSKIIGLKHYIHPNPLIIPPFGSRWLNYEFLKEYDFIDWKRLKLITLEEMAEFNQSLRSNLITRFSKSIFNFLSRFWDWVKLTPGFLLVVLIGFGIPFWVIYFFGDGHLWLGKSLTNDLPTLGRLLQGCFIGLMSTFPALLYFLFGRQQIEKLRDKFFREMIILDPHIQTMSESKTIYDPLLDSVYGAGNSNSPFAIILLLISTTLLAIGWIITLVPISSGVTIPTNLIGYFTPNYNVLTLGFLGVYFFTINMVFRRYVRADLTPKTYAYLVMRLLITFVLVWVLNVIPEFSSGETAEAMLLISSFVIGIFPEAGLTLIMERWNKFTNQKEQHNDTLSLTNLEGINLYDRARLLEEGIESIENLAHHNLVELIARTRIPTPRLVDMFDQAILYLHLGIHDNKSDESLTEDPTDSNLSTSQNSSLKGKALLNQLKFFGIRTATDLLNCIDDFETNKSVTENMDINRLKLIVETFKDDEWLDHVSNWRSTSRQNELITNPYTFYKKKK